MEAAICTALEIAEATPENPALIVLHQPGGGRFC